MEADEKEERELVPEGYTVEHNMFGAPILRPKATSKAAAIVGAIWTIAFVIFLYCLWIWILIDF